MHSQHISAVSCIRSILANCRVLTGRVEAIAFNTLRSLLVTCGADGRVVLSYVNDGKQVRGATNFGQNTSLSGPGVTYLGPGLDV
eukprot:1160142-Pelagomonas_calceolata.AAC.16